MTEIGVLILRTTTVIASAIFVGLGAAAATGQLPTLRHRQRSTRNNGVHTLLRNGGVPWTVGRFVVITVGCATASGAATLTVSPVAPLAIIPTLLGGAAPTMWLRHRSAKRLRAIRTAWPDALMQIAGGVRGGQPLSLALADVERNGPTALRQPLSGLSSRMRTVGVIPALQAVRDSIGEPVTDRVVEVLSIAHTEGGSIAMDVVEDLTEGISEEIAAAEEAEALALEGTLNARIVFALPWLVLMMLTSTTPSFLDFYTSPGGWATIGVGAVMSSIGIVTATLLSRVPEEPRVLIRKDPS